MMGAVDAGGGAQETQELVNTNIRRSEHSRTTQNRLGAAERCNELAQE